MTEWRETTLGHFAPLVYGKSLPEKQRNPAGPVPVFGSNGTVGLHDVALTDGPGIVVGRKGSVGEVHYSSGPCWPIDTTFYVEPAGHRDLSFTYYMLKHLGLQRLSGDSAVPGLNREAAHRELFRVPLYDVQVRIGTVLRTIDDLIENNRRRIELLEQMAQAIYREWFVRFRYPGHEDATLIDSPLGPIPEGWEVKPFSEIASFVNGFAFKPTHWGETGRPIIKIKQLKQGVTADTPRCDENGIKQKYWVEPGDLLFSWSADLGAYRWSDEPGLLNQHLFTVIPSEKLSLAFLFHTLDGAMPQFWDRAQGTTMRHIKRSALSEVTTAVPPQDLVDLFTAAVESADQEVISLRQTSQRLASIRDLLLPKLVTGQIDVSELDLQAVFGSVA